LRGPRLTATTEPSLCFVIPEGNLLSVPRRYTLPMRKFFLAAVLLLTASAHAQWTMQDSRTTADLRGIDNVGGGVAWASGTHGTVLRTEDAGFAWQVCAVPPGAEKLDFRGVQGFDANTAIVMSSGPGDLSRLYKTTDGCQTWTLIATNADPKGFWDAMLLTRPTSPKEAGFLYVLGDPTDGRFVILTLRTPLAPEAKLNRFSLDGTKAPKAQEGESVFAASNSAMSVGNVGAGMAFGTGGGRSSHWYKGDTRVGEEGFDWSSSTIPVGNGGASAGMFSVVFRSSTLKLRWWNVLMPGASIEHGVGVAVGGDFQKPSDGKTSAAYTRNGGEQWTSPAPGAMPHGYRSAVAYDPAHKAWITVGPNGTDVSLDDGRNWRALKPGAQDTVGADRDWNALSLPFVVGPHGRVGVLRDAALVEARAAAK
jgi:hypothetical protein